MAETIRGRGGVKGKAGEHAAVAEEGVGHGGELVLLPPFAPSMLVTNVKGSRSVCAQDVRVIGWWMLSLLFYCGGGPEGTGDAYYCTVCLRFLN